jgi:hypothetical protein
MAVHRRAPASRSHAAQPGTGAHPRSSRCPANAPGRGRSTRRCADNHAGSSRKSVRWRRLTGEDTATGLVVGWLLGEERRQARAAQRLNQNQSGEATQRHYHKGSGANIELG